MRISINGRFLMRPVTGVERYGLELVHALHELKPAQEVELLAPPKGEPIESQARRWTLRRVGHTHGHAWEQLELPLYCRGRPLLNLCNLAPVAHSNQVVVIHDAAVFDAPSGFTPAFRTAYRLALPLIARRAKRVVTVSEFSRNALAANLNIAPDRIVVIPPGVDHINRNGPPENCLNHLALDGAPYVLAVGSRDPRKNLASLAAAAARLPELRFLLAGGGNRNVFVERGIDLPPNMVPLGYVTDGELAALFKGATCFVFPSLYEGFGIPPLEAMALGCPVVASQAASIPEVCGDAALYCDATEPADIAEKILVFHEDEVIRENFRGRGRERARQFTWKRSAKAMADLLDEVFA